MNKNPLVSVVVVTYNSSKTILDTLNSIAAQTYKNVELIVTDDCSKDDTVVIVQAWIKENQERFVRVELVISETNTGTVKNINRGTRVSKGKWIKGIAGDDILKINCIQEFVSFVCCSPNCKMCCCDLELFSEDSNDISRTRELYSTYFECVKESQRKQWKRVKSNLTFPGPGYFYSRDLYNEVGGFDENYILLEETPFVFNVLKRGYRIYPVEEKLVLYRISSNSVCRGQFSTTYKILLNDKYKFFKKQQLPILLKSGMFLTALKYSIDYYKIDKEVKYGADSIQSKSAKLLCLLSPIHCMHLIKQFFKR